LTDHSQLFFLHSIVISQLFTLIASSTTATAHCRLRITLLCYVQFNYYCTSCIVQ